MSLMTRLLAMERKLTEIETRIANHQRNGCIEDVKFDAERRRWYVKMTDAEGEDDPLAYRTDWLPWASFGHGTISFSVPPRKGQRATLHGPNGQTEMAYAAPYHHAPEYPSPHDQEDEVLWRVNAPIENGEDPDPQQSVIVHHTKDFFEVRVGDTRVRITAGLVEVHSPKVLVNSPDVRLGGEGGERVARVTDRVYVSYGSSKGYHEIVEGSSHVWAVD